MYQNAVMAWGIQPSEFWGMTMAEWFTIYRAATEAEQARPGARGLTDNDRERLTRLMDEGFD